MAIFSNLDGTMKKSFILGKNGGRFTYDESISTIKVQNYQGSRLIPISVADPVEPSHAVTLGYFNTHGGGGGGGANPILRGRSEPDISLGEDGDVYMQVDDDYIVQIYIKDEGKWKPFSEPVPPTDSDYVTSHIVSPTDFNGSDNTYTYVLPENIHNRGAGVLVQLQDSTGNSFQTEVLLDDIGNITLKTIERPMEYLTIKLIGATTMTTPYSNPINKAQWVQSGDMYVLSVPASIHQQESGPLYLAIYENVVDGATGVAPYSLISTDSIIDSSGNVTFKSYVPFSGKVVISGK
ncbi:hypothetical protein BZF66_06960 [Salmonella enterica]|uniref:hypothetical protein n=1 Tax=Salmonella enterica TaxID=28901 RepID=UPI000FDF8152|nr:hypothetical protein CPT_Munch_253 [Salmonella phage Munch]EAZ2023037.1 hypothetical protein [Salmonella enterica]ECV9084173.1 hypothetical protein [Salmonella enterica subsp. enterica serovar Infantis]EHX8550489.1 hypothetical protein [Salmonella enterica]EIN7543397.1 hypothetical protein [Salmonella enterica]